MAKINPIQLQKYLHGVNYPASKQDLIDAGKKNGADENASKTLESLPDQNYNTPADVSEAVGQLND